MAPPEGTAEYCVFFGKKTKMDKGAMIDVGDASGQRGLAALAHRMRVGIPDTGAEVDSSTPYDVLRCHMRHIRRANGAYKLLLDIGAQVDSTEVESSPRRPTKVESNGFLRVLNDAS